MLRPGDSKYPLIVLTQNHECRSLTSKIQLSTSTALKPTRLCVISKQCFVMPMRQLSWTISMLKHFWRSARLSWRLASRILRRVCKLIRGSWGCARPSPSALAKNKESSKATYSNRFSKHRKLGITSCGRSKQMRKRPCSLKSNS